MNKSDIRTIKKQIARCLTEDVEYGVNKKTGQPLKRRHTSLAIFDKSTGQQIYYGTDLEMVMDKVILALYFAWRDSQEDNENETTN